MFEVGHMVYWLKKAGPRTWELKRGNGQVVCRGKRRECVEALRELIYRNNRMINEERQMRKGSHRALGGQKEWEARDERAG